MKLISKQLRMSLTLVFARIAHLAVQNGITLDPALWTEISDDYKDLVADTSPTSLIILAFMGALKNSSMLCDGILKDLSNTKMVSVYKGFVSSVVTLVGNKSESSLHSITSVRVDRFYEDSRMGIQGNVSMNLQNFMTDEEIKAAVQLLHVLDLEIVTVRRTDLIPVHLLGLEGKTTSRTLYKFLSAWMGNTSICDILDMDILNSLPKDATPLERRAVTKWYYLMIYKNWTLMTADVAEENKLNLQKDDSVEEYSKYNLAKKLLAPLGAGAGSPLISMHRILRLSVSPEYGKLISNTLSATSCVKGCTQFMYGLIFAYGGKVFNLPPLNEYFYNEPEDKRKAILRRMAYVLRNNPYVSQEAQTIMSGLDSQSSSLLGLVALLALRQIGDISSKAQELLTKRARVYEGVYKNNKPLLVELFGDEGIITASEDYVIISEEEYEYLRNLKRDSVTPEEVFSPHRLEYNRRVVLGIADKAKQLAGLKSHKKIKLTDKQKDHVKQMSLNIPLEIITRGFMYLLLLEIYRIALLIVADADSSGKKKKVANK